jgi:hypothetical protein
MAINGPVDRAKTTVTAAPREINFPNENLGFIQNWRSKKAKYAGA